MKREVAESETAAPHLADLRAFCLVSDLRSLTAAAAALGETKGTVSRRLTRLESAIGVRLLRRTARLVEPTEEGLAYRQHVARALELLDEAEASAREARGVAKGTIRLTAPSDLADALLAPLVAEFSATHPGIAFELVATDRVLDLASSNIDLALRIASKLPDSALVATRLSTVESVLVGAPDYFAHAPPLREPSDLVRHRFLWRGSVRAEHTLSFTRHRPHKSIEVRLRPSVTGSDLSFARAVALAGGGIAALPEVLVANELRDGVLRRALPGWFTPGPHLYLVHVAGRLQPARVRAFRNFVLERWVGKA